MRKTLLSSCIVIGMMSLQADAQTSQQLWVNGEAVAVQVESFVYNSTNGRINVNTTSGDEKLIVDPGTGGGDPGEPGDGGDEPGEPGDGGDEPGGPGDGGDEPGGPSVGACVSSATVHCDDGLKNLSDFRSVVQIPAGKTVVSEFTTPNVTEMAATIGLDRVGGPRHKVWVSKTASGRWEDRIQTGGRNGYNQFFCGHSGQTLSPLMTFTLRVSPAPKNECMLEKNTTYYFNIMVEDGSYSRVTRNMSAYTRD